MEIKHVQNVSRGRVGRSTGFTLPEGGGEVVALAYGMLAKIEALHCTLLVKKTTSKCKVRI